MHSQPLNPAASPAAQATAAAPRQALRTELSLLARQRAQQSALDAVAAGAVARARGLRAALRPDETP